MDIDVVSLTLGTLRDLLLEEAKFLYGVSSEVRRLESLLKEMQNLLEDAKTRQHESNSVRNWISDVRVLAYRAEDVIETYAVEISSRKGKGFKYLWKRFSCALNEGVALHQIGSKILDIRFEIDRVKASMQAYGLRPIIQGESSVSASNENQQLRRREYPFENEEDCFVGMEDDLDPLVSLIVDDKQHRVISVWGMVGIGKTTIARKIYNHTRTKNSFEALAWVCITQQCQIRSVLEDVLKQLNPQQNVDIVNLNTTDQLIRLLHGVQGSKRCFIVLDDLWQMDHWNALKPIFISTGLNNKILLTTRKQNVAAVGFSHELALLNVDDGWELLKKKASLENNNTEYTWNKNMFKQLGKEMVRKCGFLPLGICILGGILSKKSLMEWKLVNNNIEACLDGSGDATIRTVMDLSYADLPSYLKPCFLYMGLYRVGESISVTGLYQLWIAEGMISRESYGREESLMDIAEIYLRELVSRCIVQVENLYPDKKYMTCKLHDFMRELCLSKGIDENFRLKILYCQEGKLSKTNKLFYSNSNSNSNETRHLVIHFVTEEDKILNTGFTFFDQEINNHKIRSLQFLKSGGTKIEFSRNVVDFGKIKLLRVLVFENCKFEGGKLPTEIGNLIRLRQLSLRYCKLKELPDSIQKLTQLYTLTFEKTRDVRIPNVLNKMIHLKILHLPHFHIENSKNYRVRLEGLEELENLHGFNSLVHDFKSIEKMKNLREFHASVFDNKTLCKIIDGINTNWDKLHRFHLSIKENCELASSEEGLADLKKVITCTKLFSLDIMVPITKLPVYNVPSETQIIFPDLVFLVLSNTEIEGDAMEILEKLPFLFHLSLFKKSYVREVMNFCATGFAKLQVLEMRELLNLREWRIEEGAMPILKTLTIDSCQNLKTIPDGLKFITTLQNVKIVGMPQWGEWRLEPPSLPWSASSVSPAPCDIGNWQAEVEAEVGAVNLRVYGLGFIISFVVISLIYISVWI